MRQVAIVQDILREWDPLIVSPGEFAPADEYDSYAPHIVSMIVSGCSADTLATHLAELRAADVAAFVDTSRVAEELIAAVLAGPGGSEVDR